MMGARWISEAITEHLRVVMKEGDPNTVTDRAGIKGNYLAERALLADYLQLGKKIVEPKLAMRAYSGDAKDQTEFYEELDESWGPGALENMNVHIKKYTAKFLKIINNQPENKHLSDPGRLSKAQL